MPYQVRVKLVEFLGDIDNFLCHFGYKAGDEFIYDGEKFIGRVCPGLFASDMMQVLNTVRYSGLKHFEHNPLNYTGAFKIDPSMKKYDGVGYANVKGFPEGATPKLAQVFPANPPIPTERRGVAEFNCGDIRIAGWFVVEPFDLSDKGMDIPYYNREMSILEKIKAEPELTADEILNKFTQFEREEIYPALGPALLGIFLEELGTVGYINIKDGKVYPTAKGKSKSTKTKKSA